MAPARAAQLPLIGVGVGWGCGDGREWGCGDVGKPMRWQRLAWREMGANAPLWSNLGPMFADSKPTINKCNDANKCALIDWQLFKHTQNALSSKPASKTCVLVI